MAFATLAVCVSPYFGERTPFELFHWHYCCVGNFEFVVFPSSALCLSVRVCRSAGTWSLRHHHPSSSALHVLVYICTVLTASAVRDDSAYILLPNLSSNGTVC